MSTQNCINNASYPLSSSATIIDPGASGDSYIDFKINTAQKYRVGVDDSDGDAYTISPSALGTGNLFSMSASGERNLPLTPAFLGIKTDIVNNQTGDGSTYTLTFNTIEPFDQGGDFNGSTTFTAPVGGRYMISIRYRANGLAAGFTAHTLSLISSNRTYVSGLQSSVNRSGSFLCFVTIPLLIDMDASDTVIATIVWSGSTKTVGVQSTAGGNYITMSGYLVC